jgi:hypothetical protein
VTPEEIKADKRLRRTYGITLAEYNTRLAEQGGVCAICKRPPGKTRLSVDHDHAVTKTKITKTFETDWGGWMIGARPYVMPLGYDDKSDGVADVKHKLKRRSVRGILCWRCNSGLQKYSDIPERFDAAAQYLRTFLAIHTGQ